RSYISRVLRTFKQRGIVEIRRGSLGIRSLDALRTTACECNECVREHFEEVLSGVYPAEDELIAA
ncbi:MAG: Crp/Fnr family transcriptional regulator, partial [Xanthobacteraceae bacterium]